MGVVGGRNGRRSGGGRFGDVVGGFCNGLHEGMSGLAKQKRGWVLKKFKEWVSKSVKGVQLSAFNLLELIQARNRELALPLARLVCITCTARAVHAMRQGR